MRRSLVLAPLLLGLCLWMACVSGGDLTATPRTAPDAIAADFVLVNGRIYTFDAARPWADSVAVRGDTIVYVGDRPGALALAGPRSEVVDLERRLMLPGLVESHIHLALGGVTTLGVVLDTTDSIDDVLAKVATWADAHPDAEVVFGASYFAGLFDERGPNKAALDAIVPDRPVYLMDHTLHSVWVNSKALEMAGVTRETPDPPGGEYVRDAHGEPTGSVKGGPAHAPIAVATRAITAEGIAAALPRVAEALGEYGFTTAIDMGVPIATDAAYRALYELSRDDRLPLRVSVAYYVNTPTLAANAAATLDAYARRYRTETLWFDTLKISGDSVIENQKAAMLEPYLSTGDTGALYFDRAAIAKMAIEAGELGYGTTVHTIGDAAARAALQAAGDVRAAGLETRFSTTHSQMVHPDDLPMYVDYDVTAQTTGNWAIVQPSYAEHVRADLLDERQFPFRWWLDHGVNVALGADWPATPGGFKDGVHPFNNIYAAMHRAAPPGKETLLGSAPGTVLEPKDSVMTLAEAIEAYTLGGARMLGIEDQIGSIEVGKKADLIVIDRDLFAIDPEDIPQAQVLATMWNGRVVHDLLYKLGDDDLIDIVDTPRPVHGLSGSGE